jgi:F-type H+/Na+-transporting ATPase subunit alpha
MMSDGERKAFIDTMFSDFHRQLADFTPKVELRTLPPELMVTRVTENVITAYSRASLALGTTVDLSGDRQGLVFDLRRRTDVSEDKAANPNNIKTVEAQIISLGDTQNLKPGDIITSSERMLAIPVSPEMIGAVVDPLGNFLDGGHSHRKITGKSYPLFSEAPTILDREEVARPLHTGINAIDLTCPIGRGQRELIIGDQGTGKTAIAIDAIIAQRGEHMTCIYVAVGKKMQEIARIIDALKTAGAMEYTTVVIAPADTADGMKYIAPYSGMAIAEWVRSQGGDALVVFDDLSLHAQAYRKVAVSLGFPRGREAYPGDTFAIHSTLLERAGQLHHSRGGGSITAIPIVTTKGDMTAFIPTNIISITDGQIILDPKLANKNIKPAIDIGKSVSRIGSKAQPDVIKTVSKDVKSALVDFRELEAFGKENIRDSETQRMFTRGQRVQELIIQPREDAMSVPIQAILTFAIMHGYFDGVSQDMVATQIQEISRRIKEQHQNIIDAVVQGKTKLKDAPTPISDPIVNELIQFLTESLRIGPQ